MKVRKVVLGRFHPRGVWQAWRDRAAFDCNGTLTATFEHWPSSGRLNATERKALDYAASRARIAGTPLYVIWSYATPIAWVWTSKRGVEHVYRVSQKFSVTTTRHQGRLY